MKLLIRWPEVRYGFLHIVWKSVAEMFWSGLSYFSFSLRIAFLYVCSEIGKFSISSAALPVSVDSRRRSCSSGSMLCFSSTVVIAFKNFGNLAALEPSKVGKRIFGKFAVASFVGLGVSVPEVGCRRRPLIKLLLCRFAE